MATFVQTRRGYIYGCLSRTPGKILSWSPRLMRYAECETVEDIEAINPVYWEDGGSGDMEGGCWLYQLPSLKNGDNMFSPTKLAATYNGRISLWKFVGNLQSLESGVDMFAGCALDYESVRRIADTLPIVTTGNVTIGIDYTLETDTATQEALAVIRGKGWTVEEEYNLPYGFTELEYLENNGKQRIDTGIIAQDDMSFEYQFVLENYGNAYLPLFGNFYRSGAPFFGVGFINGSYRPFWGIDGGAIWMHDGKLPYGVDMLVTAEKGVGSLVMPDFSKTVTYTAESLEGNANTILIGEAPQFGNNGYIIKHKHFAIKQEEQTILDLVPVLDPTGVPCMYNKVSKQCFYNSGKGKFGYKIKATGKVADIEDLLTELEYIESSGTQRILIPVSFDVSADASLAVDFEHSGTFSVNSGNVCIEGVQNCASIGLYRSNDKLLFYASNLDGYATDFPGLTIQIDNFLRYRAEFFSSGEIRITAPNGDAKSQIRQGASGSSYYIFGSGAASRVFSGKRKYWRCYKNGSRIYDMAPVLDATGTPCMYDKISRQCFYNQGTDTFGYRIKTPDSGSSTFSLRDPYYTAPSGIYARLLAENELDVIADTDMEADVAEQEGYTWFPDTGEAYEHFGITLTEEEVIDV
jgi:hypothetical protein